MRWLWAILCSVAWVFTVETPYFCEIAFSFFLFISLPYDFSLLSLDPHLSWLHFRLFWRLFPLFLGILFLGNLTSRFTMVVCWTIIHHAFHPSTSSTFSMYMKCMFFGRLSSGCRVSICVRKPNFLRIYL